MRYFTGLTHVYGTYDPATGRVRQVKAPVTRDVIYRHLKGLQPYGVYLLVKDRIRAIAIDFDLDDPLPALEYVAAAKHYEIPAYIERSKSKGYHVWTFFEECGVLAAKARLVARHILKEIERPHTEIFPKQDALTKHTSYGNYINAPLFGSLVPKGRTVFIDETGSLKPYPDQWEFLENVQRIPESRLEEITEVNEITAPSTSVYEKSNDQPNLQQSPPTFGLPPCIQQILNKGVQSDQRITCFRLAVQLKKAGLPYDIALGALKVWAGKNRPENGKGIITEHEIVEQTAGAYNKEYRGCGCEEPAVAKYCEPSCQIYERKRSKV